MKPQYRPYHFPPLASLQAGSAQGSAATGEDWQGAVADGYRQGQRDGYEAGLEQGLEQGRADGYAEGMARALEEARQAAAARLDELAKPVDALLEGLKKLRSDYRAAQGEEMVDLVGKIARQVIRAELALQPTQLLALVDEALAAMPPTKEEVEVRLNPEELKRITELDPKRASKWNLMADPALAPGECRVRAGDHEVDAGCQSRLVACMEKVREGVEAAAVEEDQA